MRLRYFLSGIHKLLAAVLFVLSSTILINGCSDDVNSSKPDTNEPKDPQQEVAPPIQEIGVNVNGQYNVMKFNNVNRSGTKWVRGFLDFFQLYPEEGNIEADQRVQNYLKLKEQGYQNILNLKWNFSNKSFPGADSQEMEDYMLYLDKVLDKVWSSTDIIVVGNEPFIESKKSERDNRLVIFYQEVANHIRNYRAKKSRDIPIYIGAFNNLYLDSWRTEAANDLLRFARNNDWIAGVDLHIHHAEMSQIVDFIDYADLRIRDNQKMMISEFSMKDHFRAQMEKRIPETFASTYSLDPNMKNYEYIDYALKETVTREEWVDFLQMSSWFENRKNYLQEAFNIFLSYEKFHLANYALRQSYPFDTDFTANTTPWILNGLFANRTVHPDADTGQDQFNYYWIKDFKAILDQTE